MTSYFCYQCNATRDNNEVLTTNSTATCPVCGLDFLEEITEQNRSEFLPAGAEATATAAASALLQPQLLPSHRHIGSDLFGPMPMFRLGLNHMISAFDSGALDQIMTQLLGQVGNAGMAGPATYEDLARLESVSISAEQITEGSQCFVCLEEFKEADIAERLPCQHHFHSQCIRPWLERRNTCPVCRKPLSSESDDEASQSGGAPSGAAADAASGVSQHTVRARFVIDFDVPTSPDGEIGGAGGLLEDACD